MPYFPPIETRGGLRIIKWATVGMAALMSIGAAYGIHQDGFTLFNGIDEAVEPGQALSPDVLTAGRLVITPAALVAAFLIARQRI